jgi:hypothetical protein
MLKNKIPLLKKKDMKNFIIQSLETKGDLGQIITQLRSSVFKIVEQDQQ